MFGLDNQNEHGGLVTGAVTSVAVHPSTTQPRVAVKRGTHSARKSQECWQRWKRPDEWPSFLNVDEAAAFMRVSSDVIRDALHVARDGRARLAHHRLGRRIVIKRADLESFSYVQPKSGDRNVPIMREVVAWRGDAAVFPAKRSSPGG